MAYGYTAGGYGFGFARRRRGGGAAAVPAWVALDDNGNPALIDARPQSDHFWFSGASYPTYEAWASAVGATFSRASIGTYFDDTGVMQTAASGALRLDHDASGNGLGWLIEPERTNLIANSRVLGAGSAITITADATIAPDGTTTADKSTPTVTSTAHLHEVYPTSLTGNAAYASSFYLKPAGYGIFESELVDNVSFAAGAYSVYDLGAGSIFATGDRLSATATQSSQIEAATAQGFRRCILNLNLNTVAATTWRHRFGFKSTTANSLVTSWAGDGSSGGFVWGRQLELGGFATSYIPTGASAVTRLADALAVPLANADFDVRVEDSEGSEWRDATVGSGSYAITPRANKRHVQRLTVFANGVSTERRAGIDAEADLFFPD